MARQLKLNKGLSSALKKNWTPLIKWLYNLTNTRTGTHRNERFVFVNTWRDFGGQRTQCTCTTWNSCLHYLLLIHLSNDWDCFTRTMSSEQLWCLLFASRKRNICKTQISSVAHKVDYMYSHIMQKRAWHEILTKNKAHNPHIKVPMSISMQSGKIPMSEYPRIAVKWLLFSILDLPWSRFVSRSESSLFCISLRTSSARSSSKNAIVVVKKNFDIIKSYIS